jgi:hypothetical protein
MNACATTAAALEQSVELAACTAASALIELATCVAAAAVLQQSVDLASCTASAALLDQLGSWLYLLLQLLS